MNALAEWFSITRERIAWLRVFLASYLFLSALLLVWSGSTASHAQGGDEAAADPTELFTPLGQDLRFERLTDEQGLSSNMVVSIIQDSKGFIWFGTSDGLDRYDGYEFRTFKYDPDDENSLSINSVQTLYEDQAGALWVGTNGGGLNHFDRATEQFTRYRHDPDDPHSLGSDRVLAIYQDRQGEIWIGTGGGGLNRIELNDVAGSETETGNGGDARFIRYLHDPDDPQSLSDNVVTAIYEDQQGALWVGTSNGGLNRCNWSAGDGQAIRCTSYQHNPDDPDSLGSNEVKFIHEDRAGVLWIGTWGGGLERLDPQTKNVQAIRFTHYQHHPEVPYSLSDNIVVSIHEDESGSLWVGTARGLNRFDPQTDEGQAVRFTHYQPDPNNPYSLNHPVVLALYGDQAGNLWIGTLAGGVHRLDLEAKPFAHFRNKPQDTNSLASNDLGAVYEDQTGVLWIGTRGGGLDRLDRQTGQVTHYVHLADAPHSLSDDRIRAIVEDRMGMLWIGTADGLNRFDRETEEFVRYHHDATNPNSLSNNSIHALHVDHTGMLWVGTFSGLDRFEPDMRQFVHFRHDPNDPQSLSNDTVRTIHEDQAGALWIGMTGGGLNRFDRETQQFTRYQHRPGDPQSLGDNEVISIYQDSAGTLWVGTSTGLDRFDLETDQFVHYGESDGLPGASVVGILEEVVPPDLGGPNLWLSTSRGLSRFNPQSESFRNYDVSDGLQGNQFTVNAVYKSSSGEMFFGGLNGLSAFFPSEIQDSPYVPPVVITDFELSNLPVEIGETSVLQHAIAETDHVTLSYHDRVISFEFAALDYRAPKKNLYRYTLEGFDEGWNETSSDRRYVTYTNLDPGEYVFRVTGSNNDGVWNEEGAAIRLTITPPWWGTWWFRGAVLLLVVGLVAGGYSWRVRRIQARSRELEQEVAANTRDLQAVNTRLSQEILERQATEERLRKAHDELSTLLVVSQDVVSTLDLDYLLELIMNQLEQVLEFDAVSIHLLEEGVLKSRAFRFNPVIGVTPPERLAYDEIPVFGEMVDSLKGFVLADLQEYPAMMSAIIASSETAFKDIPDSVHGFMAAPLAVRNSAIGMLAVSSAKPDVYSQESLDLLQAFANQAAIAIENAQLYEKAQETAALEERNRLARELHDSVTQTLYGTNLFADAAHLALSADSPREASQNLDVARDLIWQAMLEMRLLLFELRPPLLEEQGLVGALQTRLESVEGRVELPIEFRVEGEEQLPPGVEAELYFVALEALNNIAKHAQAKHATVLLKVEEERCLLAIEDDGVGLDPEAARLGGGQGLRSMRERIEQIGGRLTLDTAPESGTTIKVEVNL